MKTEKPLFIACLLAIALAGTSAYGDTTPLAQPVDEGKTRVSILGDSYSTFEGCIPEGNDCWYFKPPKQLNDVCEVSQTWWHLVIDKIGGVLEKNDSYSGATICNAGYKRGKPDFADYSDRSFITRAPRLGNPDLILVCGGTNDSWAGSPIGTNVWENWSSADLWTFRGGLSKTFSELKGCYPKAKVVFILNSELKAEINDAVHDICGHYAIPCIDLHDIAKQRNHPSIAGMAAMADQVVEFLRDSKTTTGQ